MQNEFGAAISRLRRERKLSLRSVSEALRQQTGVSIDPSGIKRIEDGSRDPRLSEIRAIAAVLDTSAADLVAPTRAEDLSSALTEVLNRYSEISHHYRVLSRDLKSLNDQNHELLTQMEELVIAAEESEIDGNVTELVETARRIVKAELGKEI